MDKNKSGSRFSVLTENLLTWLMCVVSMSAAVYIYVSEVISIYTLLSAAFSAGLIWIFNRIRKKKLGGLIYFAMMIAVGFVPNFLIDLQGARHFVMWFFSGAQAAETRTSFMLALVVLMGFFLTSATYYFTKIIYRSLMLMLVSLIPFALAVKTVVQLPVGYIVIMAGLNLVAFIADGRKNILKGAKSFNGGQSALTVYTDFTVAAVLLAFLVPKPTVAPFYDKFEAIANRFQFGGTGETYYQGQYNSGSGNADEFLRGESRLLYILSTNDPVYMKAQVFDYYDSEERRWVTNLDELTGDKDWEEDAVKLNFGLLADAVEKAAANDDFGDIYPQAARLGELDERESFSIVYAREFPAVYVLAPLRMTGVNLSNTGAQYSAMSDAGEVFTNMRRLPPNGDYTVKYLSESILNELIYGGFCDISFEDYGTFLSQAFYASEDFSEEKDVLSEFVAQHQYAEEYRERTEAEVSEEIQVLADDLTEGMEYDYQKAQAIEQYFLKGDYVYNIAYEAPKALDTPEYFIFESKMGTCSDFATAFTLLARAAGLTVRYVEGYVPQSSEESEDVYFINTENAHAYPEVYIAGAGWVIFEPTAADLTGGSRGDNEENGETDYVAMLLTAIVFVIGIGTFILLVLITPKFMECIFRIRVRCMGGSKGVIMLYNKHIRNLEAVTETSCKALTPEQLAECTEEKTELSLAPMIKPFIAACYGGIEIGKDEFEAAYICYNEQAKAMRKSKKKRKE